MGFALDIGLIDHLQVVTTSNTITKFHTLKITTAQAKSLQSAVTSRFLVTDLSNRDFSASVLNCTDEVFSSQTPLQLTNF
jgi:hypothetical protein